MTGIELSRKLSDIAGSKKTVYVLGCFGAPITSATINRYLNAYQYNKGREKILRSVCDKGYFGFDCVCLIKAILWGWSGDASHPYGGAVYKSGNVPDINDKQMIDICKNISTDFSSIEVGEAVWTDGHIGVYIGDGLACECTPSWKNGVQITACNCEKKGYNTRYWKKHGKLPYISYDTENEKAPSVSYKKYTVESGDSLWAISERFLGSGVRYTEIVKANKLSSATIYSGQVLLIPSSESEKTSEPLKTIDEIAREVIRGSWGNGGERRDRLSAAGYDYNTVQSRVDELLK